MLGLNGAGKTSLLRILMGETGTDAGTFAFGHGVVPGYYAQEHEGIHDGVTVLDHMKEASDADDLALRTLLGMFGLHGEVAFQDAGTLSGGEKTKLALGDPRRRQEEPAAPGRADEQPRPAVAHGDRGGASGVAGRHGAREPRSGVRRSACAGTGPADAGRGDRTIGATSTSTSWRSRSWVHSPRLRAREDRVGANGSARISSS